MSDFRPRLHRLIQNLWWTWQPDVDSLFRSIHPELWRRVNHNPSAFLADIDDATLDRSGVDLQVHLARAERQLRDYLAHDNHWTSMHAPGLFAAPVAYFSAEFCIHETLPIYSGGLGVLAGDHLKSCSDLGVPAVGVSLLYRSGYFTQELDAHGRQIEVYRELDTSRVPIDEVHDSSNRPMSVTIPVDDGTLTAAVWQVRVGRCVLYLLDVQDCTIDHFPYAQRLYGGDGTTRLIQEVVLGVAGYRTLRELGMVPAVIHLNEGHCAFVALEAIATRMEETGLAFEDARAEVVDSIVFTTHTPVDAGHDRFAPQDVLQLLHPLQERLRLSDADFLGLGRVDPANEDEPFCMTVLALKLSRQANGVSSLHGVVSRRMWQSLWPYRRASEVPIGHITNGVHVPTWIAAELDQLYSDSLGADWKDHICDAQRWQAVDRIDEADLWAVKRSLKRRMFEFIHRRETARRARLGISEPPPSLSTDALTIGFARRAAEYKRAMLLLEDSAELRRLLVNPRRPVQIVLAGKAHPNDDIGKDLLRRLMDVTQDQDLRDRVVFIEDYDKNVSRHMLEGCDLWLNTPRRPHEACGTSGMKAVFNACLNCSTLDGWWDEAYDTRNGFAFGKGMTHVDRSVQDRFDRESLLDVLADEVIPLFYHRDTGNVPTGWLRRVKHALRSLAWRYNSDRMVIDYARSLYRPASRSLTAEMRY